MQSVEIILNCPSFDFEAYPFDVQVCEFYVGSYLYEAEYCLYRGHLFYNHSNQRPLPYDVKEIVALPFENGLLKYREQYFSMEGQLHHEVITYSYFGVRAVFTRRLQPFLICVFASTGNADYREMVCDDVSYTY